MTLAAASTVVLLSIVAAMAGGHAASRVTRPVTGSALTGGPDPARVTPTSDPTLAYLASPAGPGHLQPGSDPSVLPAPILIADEGNNRLIIVDAQGRIRWSFPRPGDLRPGQTFAIPDDAFFTPDGRYIIATQEDDFTISIIDIATERIVGHYGHPGVPGMGPGYVFNPDDAMVLPNGDILTADIKNCRLLVVPPGGTAPSHVYGLSTNSCFHDPPQRWGSPNGAFPLHNGDYLVTEIDGDWVDELNLNGTVVWSTHPPGVAYPSDTNEIGPDRYLTVDYSSPGQVVIFNRAGAALWRYVPSTPSAGLDHPSLALPLPNGDIILNDDHNDRIIVIDPRSNRIVWQYGHTGVPGSTPGYLHIPDGIDVLPPFSLLVSHARSMGLPPN